MKNSITLFSPAKLNLFLRVIRKRPDGYHELASLFQAIDLGDTITYTLTDGEDILYSTDPNLPHDSSNLIFKAATLFRKKTSFKCGLKVGLIKRIPIQAGLGGGSSNAATTLWALNQLTGNRYSTEELAEWSKELGSDITFFFSHGTAYCTGRGEEIHPINCEIDSGLPLWLLKPKEGLSTPEVFKNFNLLSCSLKQPMELLNDFLGQTPCYVNDLESAAFKIMPRLQEIKRQLLEAGYQGVTMTGSGTALFCFGKNPPENFDSQIFKGDIFQVNYLRRSTNNWYQ